MKILKRSLLFVPLIAAFIFALAFSSTSNASAHFDHGGVTAQHAATASPVVMPGNMEISPPYSPLTQPLDLGHGHGGMMQPLDVSDNSSVLSMEAGPSPSDARSNITLDALYSLKTNDTGTDVAASQGPARFNC